ncbi:hypothetical protein HT031_000305 [Scenedesmus sp. PABB004]|nr:hypothetical protein HT031_000305 [Scenedesmus sp. PABB004]
MRGCCSTARRRAPPRPGLALGALAAAAPLLVLLLAAPRGAHGVGVFAAGFAPGAGASSQAMAVKRAVVGNAELGIQTFSFPVALPGNASVHGVSFAASELRVFLRLFCAPGGGSVGVRGFSGLFPTDPGFTAAAYFYKQPSEAQPALRLSLRERDGGGAWPLRWQDGDDARADMGLWPLRGPDGVRPRGLSLVLEGAALQHHVPLPACAAGDGGGGGAAPLASRAPAVELAGVWNVVTTTSPNPVPPATLARLLLLHGAHHARLGFNGTLLRCNPDEALALAAMPSVAAEVAAGRLLIWPWVWGGDAWRAAGADAGPAPGGGSADGGGGGSADGGGAAVRGPQPYFWQVPRNQLALLAGHGRGVRLAFFDLDEYLVLPRGGAFADASCGGRALLSERGAGATLVRYAALAADCGGADELACWEAGAAPGGPGVALQLAQCPCLLGKPVLHGGRVVNTRVHKSTPAPGYVLASPDPGCGFLVHLQALIASSRPWDRPWDRTPRNDMLVRGRWLPQAAGSARFTPDPGQPRLVSGKECIASGRELLRRCSQG